MVALRGRCISGLALGVAAAFALAGCGSGSSSPPGSSDAHGDLFIDTTPAKGSITPLLGGLPTVAATSGPLNVAVKTPTGAAAAGALVTFQVALGGGKVEPASVTADPAGNATTTWTLGPAPVLQRVQVQAEGTAIGIQVAATLPQPWTPETFGDIEAYLKSAQIDGSTEDLAFAPDGLLQMAVPGGILQVDASGKTTPRPLTGEPLVGPLGMAFDAQGVLWVADSKGKALRRVATDGSVSTAATGDGVAPFKMPNDVAIDAQGRVWLTDTCLGEMVRYDPALAKVDRVVVFDATQVGGPNGVTVGADGRVWVTTENNVLFCGSTVLDVQAPVAALFVVPPDKPVPQLIAGKMGLFGDGLAFDHEGNLYVLFDREHDFQLTESSVWVFTIAGQAGKVPPQRLLSAGDRLFANLAFGTGAFGTTRMYLSLLAVPPFTTARGLQRFELGIAGQ